jgi:hypothetical protein
LVHGLAQKVADDLMQRLLRLAAHKLRWTPSTGFWATRAASRDACTSPSGLPRFCVDVAVDVAVAVADRVDAGATQVNGSSQDAPLRRLPGSADVKRELTHRGARGRVSLR